MAWSLLSLVSHARIRSGLFRVTISWNSAIFPRLFKLLQFMLMHDITLR